MEHQLSVQGNSQLCPNCNFPLTDDAVFCQKCGQKISAIRLTVKEFISQFFANVFNLDSKIFQTFGAIFIPGKLSNAFLKGQRKKYIHPIRLFLVFMVIAVAALNFQKNLTPPGNLRKAHIDRYNERKRLMGVLDQSIDTIVANTDQHSVHETLDSLSNLFYRNSGRRVDSINLNDAIKIANDADFYISLDDFGKYSPDEILDVYDVKGFTNRLKLRQKVKLIQEETSFIPFVLGKATWSVFIVLLLLTLAFRVLYFWSDFLYLEHLIFGIHLNSFFLIIASILILIPEHTLSYTLPIAFLVMAIYLFIAMKRVYNQSYVVTFIKWLVVLVCYFMSFIFGIVLTMIGSFLLF